MTALPTSITPGDTGHDGHHDALHTDYNYMHVTGQAPGRLGHGTFANRSTVFASPAINDTYIATDINRRYWWNGTRWVAPDEGNGVNPLDYGAKGDLNANYTTGTDDTAAFTQARAVALGQVYADLKTNKIAITAPPGGWGYRVDGPVPNGQENTVWEGQAAWSPGGGGTAIQFGRPGQVLLYSFGNGPINQDVNTTAPGQGLIMRNLLVSANQVAWEWKGKSNFRADNCHFESRTTSVNADYAGCRIRNSFWWTFRDCSFASGHENNRSCLILGDNTTAGIDISYLGNFEGQTVLVRGMIGVEQRVNSGGFWGNSLRFENITSEDAKGCVEYVNASGGPIENAGVVTMRLGQSADHSANWQGTFIMRGDPITMNGLILEFPDLGATDNGVASWPPLNVPTGHKLKAVSVIGGYAYGVDTSLNRGSGGQAVLGHVVWQHHDDLYSPTLQLSANQAMAGAPFPLECLRIGDSLKRAASWTGDGTIQFLNNAADTVVGAINRDAVFVLGRLGAGDGTATRTSWWGAAGVPSNAVGANGDWCMSDNGHIYFKASGTWGVKV